MKPNKLVSIITVCYNSDEYIEDTIRSVLNQTYPNIEYILIDGQSTDDTLDIIKEYEPLFEGRMRWISEPDKGIYDAMNKGISFASGEIIGILNSDDWYEQKTVEIIVEEFLSNPSVDILHGKMSRFDSDGSFNSTYGRKSDWLSFADQAPFNHPTCFVLDKTYREIGNFDTRFKIASDYDFMLRAYRTEEVKTKFVPKILTNFRLTGITTNSVFPVSEVYQILRKNNFGPFKIFLGILVRFSRYLLKNILEKSRLDYFTHLYRKNVSHHENSGMPRQ